MDKSKRKKYIQNLVKAGQLELVTSYVLQYENSRNPFDLRRIPVNQFMESNSTYHVDTECAGEVDGIAKGIMKTGIKTKDAYHIACAVVAECDYFLSTDDRLLKYHSDQLELLDPIDFIKIWEVNDHE